MEAIKVANWDVNKIRQDFPILSERVHGKALVYLDNAATTQKPRQVIGALSDFYWHYNANVHRAIHQLGEKATTAYETARQKIARFINAESAKQIVFTRGTTEAINLVAAAWGRKYIETGDEIITTEMEHHSNLVPWQILAKQTGARLKFIPFNPDGTLDWHKLRQLFSTSTKLVALTHMSNVFGTINPVKEIIGLAHERGVPVLLDGAQSVPHLEVDVRQLDCDFLAFSGHKMLAPTGIGVLYAKTEWLQNMNPYQGGGEMINTVSLENATWNEIPHKFEAGTPNISGAIALGVAIDYLQQIGMRQISGYEQELTSYALKKMGAIEGMKIYGQAVERGSAISFNLGPIHPHDLSHFLDQQGIAVRAGHHCAQPIMQKLNVPATTRASFYLYNTFDEIDYFIEQLQAAREFFAFL